MSDEKKNIKDLVWINTPFSFTKLDKQYSLLQQNILLVASSHLQKYVDEYFTEKRQLGDSRSDYLFEKGIQHVVMDVPPISIDIQEFQVSQEFHNYKQLREVLKNDILNMSVRVKSDDGTEKIQHVFSNIEIPTTKNGYTKTDGEKVERIKGVVKLEIDPKLTMNLFDMGQGYIHHLSMIAKYSRRLNTPRIYIYLLRQMGLTKSLTVKVEFLALKKYLGLVELDENGKIALDEKGEPIMNKYPKFSQFKKQVLDVAREDLNRMAERNETDIVFEDFKKEDFLYVNKRRKGDPDYIIFHIARTAVGKNHIGDKNADIAKRLDDKINRAAKAAPIGEGDIFAHVYQTEENNIQVEMGEGQELWNKFKKKIKGKKQLEVLERCKLLGMKNERFLINCNDEDFELITSTKLGIMQKAQEFFNCVGSFAPVFYRG